MNKNKKGFTLIELLAVIVILAIIALIATPIVLNIINNSRESALLRSAELYIDTVEKTIVEKQMDSQVNLAGIYEIRNGNLYQNNELKLEIKVQNSKPTTGSIEIQNGNITSAKFKINNKNLSYDGKTVKTTTDNLPLEYQRVEYIEGTGTQYIDTDYIPKQNSIINIDFKTTKLENENFTSLFGCQNSINNGRLYILFGTSNNIQVNFPRNKNTYYGLSSDSTISEGNVSSETPYWNSERTNYIVDILNKKVSIGDKTWDLSNAIDNYVDLKYSLYLLNRNLSGSPNDANSSKGYLYGVKIYEENTLVRELIPCYKKSDNTIGLYDTVTNKFYTNVGTGTFNKGKNV